MEHQFVFVSEDVARIGAALEVALWSKVDSPKRLAFLSWSVNTDEATMALYLHPNGGQMFPIPLSSRDVAPMMVAWVNATEPKKIKHEHDVMYHKGFRIEGHPFDPYVSIAIIETEYHK
jgi:hypothetical protein